MYPQHKAGGFRRELLNRRGEGGVGRNVINLFTPSIKLGAFGGSY